MNNNAYSTAEYIILAERHQLLFDALIYCSTLQSVGRKYVFTINERILINQERGSIMSQQTHLVEGNNLEIVRSYVVPAEIENKIQFIKTKL